MKTTRTNTIGSAVAASISASALAFAALTSALLFPAPLRAGVDGAPGFVDYQGTVFDSQGNPLGSTIASEGLPRIYDPVPTNYIMEFRIYDQQTAGTLIYAETQTVTVSLGKFSVRLGLGASIPEEPAPTAPTLATAFDQKDRYLGVTVQIPGQEESEDSEIRPRLAFLSSPFSLVADRARLADTATSADHATSATSATSVDGNITGNITSATISGVVTIAPAGSISGDGSGLTNLTAGELTGNLLTEKLRVLRKS